MIKIPIEILREYDIRGQVPGQLSPLIVRRLGQAFGNHVLKAGGCQVVVGRDGRLSSPELETALVEGLTSGGVNVTRIGLGPTPMLYFGSAIMHADGGIMLTGSHNPADYNGMKMIMGGNPFFGEDIQDLARLAMTDDLVACPPGSVSDLSILELYLEGLLAEAVGGRPLRVIWDCGNGAAGAVVPHLVERLPGQHTILFGDVDGRFPNHHPDPTEPHNLVDLRRAILAQGADIGLAFDGDADRLGVLDSTGRIIWADQILLLFAQDILSQHPGAPIIADVKTSRLLFDGVSAAGGHPVMYRTGHSLIKSKMREISAPLAGEMSGHIFFADRWFGFDDALYASMRLLRLIAGAEPGWLERQVDAFPTMWNTPEIRISCSDERKFDVISSLKEILLRDGIAFNDIDGVRVENHQGWWLLRASNTQPVLVARCEGRSRGELEAQKSQLLNYMESLGLSAKDLATI